MPDMDFSRHMELFDPYSFNTPVHIIGVGATGSWLALFLAKLGIQDVTVWDYDIVEEHNIPNQAFGLRDVGLTKVDALTAIIAEDTACQIKANLAKFTNQRLAGYVFLMVDSMEQRKLIWENAIRYKPQITHLVEPRMGLDIGRIYNINPTDAKQIKEYENTYYSDDTAEVSACGTSLTVITSAVSTASWCARQLINHVNGEELDNEILIDYKYNNIVATRW